jgi:hypothetical protein
VRHYTVVLTDWHDDHWDLVPSCACGWHAAPWCYRHSVDDRLQIQRMIRAELELHEDLNRGA